MAIAMRHPDVEPLAYAVDDAQAAHMAVFGWERVDDVVAAAAEITGEPVSDLEALTVAQLRTVANERGIDVPARATKAELISALEEAPAEATNG